MTKWIVFVTLIVAGSILGYLYYQIEVLSSEVTFIPPPPNQRAATVVDGYADGVHRYSGEIKLPHSCYTVDQSIFPNPKDPKGVIIVLVSHDHMLDRKLCAQISTGYPFGMIYDAPEDTMLTVMLDGKILPLRVIKKNWQNPTGGIIRTIGSSTAQ